MKISNVIPSRSINELISLGRGDLLARDNRLINETRKLFKLRKFRSLIPASEFPELIIEIPNSWPHVIIAPLYDVHIGHSQHDAALFERHANWLAKAPYVLSFDGGDLIENASKLSVGSGVYEQDYSPHNQLVIAIKKLAHLRHKMLFKLPGNHEDRTLITGVDIGAWLAWLLDIPYFPDFCFCTVKFAGNNFRILAHHGTGSAQTAGGQIMAARKAVPFFKPFDVYWTGHLHSSNVAVLYQTDFDQKTGRAVERHGLIIVSPSYMKYFGTYAAKRAYAPGLRGLHAITLHRDGRIDANVHANGRRL